jgi:hypothetical protein
MTTHPTRGGASPWGFVQTVQPLGPDAAFVNTASHGGIWVSPEGLARIPAALRSTAYSGGGWFEEDCDWSIPYLALGLHRHEDPATDRGEQLRSAARVTFQRFHQGDPASLEALAA